jgi:hypothetical protein
MLYRCFFNGVKRDSQLQNFIAKDPQSLLLSFFEPRSSLQRLGGLAHGLDGKHLVRQQHSTEGTISFKI